MDPDPGGQNYGSGSGSYLEIFVTIESSMWSNRKYIIKIDKIFNFFQKFLSINDKIVRIWMLLTDPDPQLGNSELRTRITEAN
jgi:hypothetical protein